MTSNEKLLGSHFLQIQWKWRPNCDFRKLYCLSPISSGSHTVRVAHGYVPSVLGVAQLWLPHGLYQQNKNEKTGEMAQKLRACTALAEDHIPVPAPTTGGSQTPVAPASGDLLFHHTHRTENKISVFLKKGTPQLSKCPDILKSRLLKLNTQISEYPTVRKGDWKLDMMSHACIPSI